MTDRLEEIEHRFEQIEGELQDPAVASDHTVIQRLGKARAELEPLVLTFRQLKRIRQELEDTRSLLADPEMKELAEAEIGPLEASTARLESELQTMLLPKDPNDDKSVIVEIRPAAGGDEAALFAAELYRMYVRYAERRRWKYELIDEEESGIGGMSRVVFQIDAAGAYSQLKHESGVHRVQRVPATESSGRTHTSTVTVAVLPEADEADVDMKMDDLEISTYRASSAGGQNVQKVETAIRVIHKPTGLVVTCQDQRSQTQNKLQALAVMRAKLYQAELEKLQKERASERRSQIGTGDRSEKIRTYNFPQSRITDHRIGLSVHNTVAFMDGDIQEMIDALIQEDQRRKLEEDQAA
jgi:peptide chain release factor 1